jgi:protocatechuate 3,4-dioxygenase beta subunit
VRTTRVHLLVALLISSLVLSFAVASEATEATAAAADSHIAGRVTDASGTPLEGVYVHAFRPASGDQFEDVTDADGRYDVGGLVRGSFVVHFRADGYASEYYGDAVSNSEATRVEMDGVARVDGIDTVLDRPSYISGRVTDTVGRPVPGIRVSIWPFSAESDAQGRYRVEVDRGTHTARAEGTDDYLYETYRDAEGDTEFLVPKANEVQGIDFVMRPAGHITGTVTLENGNVRIPEVELTLYQRTSDGWGQAGWFFDQLGGDDHTYDIGGLEPGEYRLQFAQRRTTSGGHFSAEYWNERYRFEQADTIHIGLGQVVRGINASLRELPHIRGRVLDTRGNPVEDAEVVAEKRSGSSWVAVNGARTRANGSYDMYGFGAGIYRIKFSSPDGRLTTEYWNGAAGAFDERGAVEFELRGFGGAKGVDAVLDPAAHIVGGATSPIPGDPLDVGARLYRRVGKGWQEWPHSIVRVLANGRFDLGGLAAGTYRLWIGGGQHDEVSGVFWPRVSSVAQASDIKVPSGRTITLGDVALPELSSIAGRVTDAAGAPVANLEVRSYLWQDGKWEFYQTWDGDGWAYTDLQGRYEVDELPIGTYRLQFVSPNERHVWEYWNDGHDLGSGTEIELTGSSATADVVLDTGATIRGTVTTAVDARWDLWVEAQRAVNGDWEVVDRAGVEENGDYRLDVAPGTYRVRVGDSSGENVTSFWSSTPGAVEPEEIHLPSEVSSAEGIDLALARAGRISGHLVTSLGGRAYGTEVYVFARRAGAWEKVTSEYVNHAMAKYDIGGLPPGDYRVGFRTAVWSDLASELWRDAPSLASATEVHVEPATATRVDGVLSPPVRSVSTPRVRGTPRVGKVLRVLTRWTPLDTRLGYLWRANGKRIRGADGPTYRPRARDSGKRLTVSVAGSRLGYHSAALTVAVKGRVRR